MFCVRPALSFSVRVENGYVGLVQVVAATVGALVKCVVVYDDGA